MRKEEVRPYLEYLKKKQGSLYVKRAFDLVASFILLLVFSPLMIYLAIRIRMDSKGKALFCQTRITRLGKPFKIYKFRTMRESSGGGYVTSSDDGRITRFGQKLRSMRLDELPQLLNVIKGEMTFVGTRPEVPAFVKQYTPEMYAVLLLPAGITSRTSLEFRNESEILKDAKDADKVYAETILPEKMKHNLEELRRFSLGSDIVTMWKTVESVICRRKRKG